MNRIIIISGVVIVILILIYVLSQKRKLDETNKVDDVVNSLKDTDTNTTIPTFPGLSTSEKKEMIALAGNLYKILVLKADFNEDVFNSFVKNAPMKRKYAIYIYHKLPGYRALYLDALGYKVPAIYTPTRLHQECVLEEFLAVPELRHEK